MKSFENLNKGDVFYLADHYSKSTAVVECLVTKKTDKSITYTSARFGTQSYSKDNIEILNQEGFPHALFESKDECLAARNEVITEQELEFNKGFGFNQDALLQFMFESTKNKLADPEYGNLIDYEVFVRAAERLYPGLKATPI